MKKIFKFLSVMAGLAFVLTSCASNDSMAPNPGQATGQGGSMARFAVSGNYLYTVDDTKLNLFDISNPNDPVKANEVALGFGIETVFPFQDKLFIGTQTGMQIFSIQTPETPKRLSTYEHVVSCDPVVTDGRYAYITLRSGTPCQVAINELQIVDLQNIANPVLVKQYPMSNPKGLGIDGNLLFVCDEGLKVYDATDVLSLRKIAQFNIDAYDVIPNKGNLLVIGSDGFYQYSYTDQKINLLSKIAVQPAG